MDFVLEVLVEVVGRILLELFAELLFELGVRGIAAVVRNWVTRFLLMLFVGFTAGAVWAGELLERGHTERPRLFVVSLLIAAGSAAAAFYRWTRDREALRQPTGQMSLLEALGDIFAPWRWDAVRLGSFTALNLSIAAGVAVGWS
jgi:hypothetical protein